MKNKLKRVLSFVLCLVMVFSLFPQITPQVRAADFAAGSGVDPIDGNGYPTSCKGPVVLALCFMGDTFPGEPSEHSVGDYLRYGLSFTRANDYFDASEVLQNVIDADGNVADGYVMGKYTSGWNTANSVTGIFDPNGLDDEYFTAKFNAALAEHEQDMISDVIAAKQSNNQTVGSTNPADYEIVWYIIKYQYNKSWFSTTGEWHVNGLIREKDKYSVVYDANGATVGSPPDGVIDMSYQDAKHYTVQTNNRGLSRGNAYNFIGWNTMPDGSGVFFSPGQADVDLTAIGLNPITLYAQWAEKEKWSVNWLNYDGNPVHVDIDLSEGSSVTYDGATPTRAPDANYVYIFEGWAETQNGTNLGTAPTITVPNNNKNMYALYRAEDRTYTVTWVNHTVIETDSNISKGGSARYDGATPTRSTTETEGYLFAG